MKKYFEKLIGSFKIICIFAAEKNIINNRKSLPIMAPKRNSKVNTKKAKRPRKKFKYIKIVELVEDPYNLN